MAWHEHDTPPAPKILTSREVAALLRIDLDTLYRAIRRGDVPAYRVGRQWRFHLDEVMGGCLCR